jgi:hypothetical protein
VVSKIRTRASLSATAPGCDVLLIGFEILLCRAR